MRKTTHDPDAAQPPAARPLRKFKTTGAMSILGFVGTAGAKGVTGEQIAQRWKAEGRGAGCYGLLGQLVKAKKIKRRKVKGQRGSVKLVARAC